MFGKKIKTLFDFIEEHEPYNNIESLIKPKYYEGTVTVEHKELESIVDEYWDYLHDLVKDFINSYAITYQNVAKDIENNKEAAENARRQLTFEQQNVQDLTDQVRDLKGQLQNEIVVRRDLEARLNDERKMLEAQFEEERKSLEILANANLSEGQSLEDILQEVHKSVADSTQVKALKDKISELEEQIKREREENEKIQEELSMSFMTKITKYDEMIRTLKQRLGEE